MKPQNPYNGVIIAIVIISLWTLSLVFWLHWATDFYNPITYVGIIVQTHLYTGLFITAHDSMHSVVSSHKILNHFIGRLCTILFAFNFYGNLLKKHHEHHRFVATKHDPDYHESGNFWRWYISFTMQYVNIWQFILMAIAFNVLILYFQEINVVIYWMIPSILSTLQLFYFGTYLPHKNEHLTPSNIYFSKSMRLNHTLAFLSCYFFGYHYEHHAYPHTPWWLLYKRKEAQK
jgi:beta-carotene ketolase (CrtW type)